MNLTKTQTQAIEADGSSLLIGSAGTGKTTVLKQRLLRLIDDGVPAYTILVLVAEPNHRDRFWEMLAESEVGPLADLKVVHFNGLAREMVNLFWPIVARRAGFGHAFTPPTWLTYDLAQLLMWEVVRPLLETGYFDNLRLRPQQIVSQLLDNLNRAALNRLTIQEGISRQIDSWVGDGDHIRLMRDAQQAAEQFRNRCLTNNLLDLSLTIDVFDRYVLNHEEFARYFSERFRHVLVDNIEEQTAAGQAFVSRLLNISHSATISLDDGGGYKRFLAADPNLAERFRDETNRQFVFDKTFTESQGVYHLARQVARYVQAAGPEPDLSQVNRSILGTVTGRYRREMLQRLAFDLQDFLQREEIKPADVAIIVPYLDGALRYKLTQSLREAGLPYQLSRRRASPREEPYVRAWMTWLALANPTWGVFPSLYDVSEALSLTIFALDPARATLMARFLYNSAGPALLETSELTGEQRVRLGEEAIDRVEQLRRWLSGYDERTAREKGLDFFINDFFDELLSHRDFAPEPSAQAGAVCDWLVRLATRLRQASKAMGLESEEAVGRAFINGIQNGLVTAHPPDMGDPPDPDGIFIGSIYSFLLSDRVAAVQVWLETAATGWWDIPRQPLSNAFVLSEDWQDGQLWTLEDDVRIRNEMLVRVVKGLCARCSNGVMLATSELDRRGVRQDGVLWRALQGVLVEDIS
ncbi:MAG: UvrD-helicase domain-containing protein [Ardenticatenaceae bacterium]|nr:UvrD-helicase domain-containing protein [Ardenticatenaceae bacterium]